MAGDADWDVPKQIEHAVIAAIYLYQITGDQTFNQYVQNHAQETEPLMTGFWGGYKLPLTDAFLVYTTLPGHQASLASNITNSFSRLQGTTTMVFLASTRRTCFEPICRIGHIIGAVICPKQDLA